MSFGGGSPGMSILLGVARGVAEDDKRRRQMEQEAINKRLKEQQITNMEETTQLNKERETRYRDTEIARQENLELARRDAEVKRLQDEESRQMLTGLMAKQHEADGEDPLTAMELATLDMAKMPYPTDPDEELSVRDAAFMEDRATAEDLELDMKLVWGNTELSHKISEEAQNVLEARDITNEYNAINGTEFSPEAGEAVWKEINISALDPALEWGDWSSLPEGAKKRVEGDASVYAGTALYEAEKEIAKWHSNNQPKDGEEPKEWDEYEWAADIIRNKNKDQKYGPFGQAVADRMLFELERLRQADHGEEEEEEGNLTRTLTPENSVG